ncbi:MAG: ferrochelatase [Alphaproteobacteria bacterium]|jgi:ferrochelatase|nr:ferrochelatase [Alphaproteobacteria bacterium]MDP7221696.1 ferrochelatase [Alphaproteobacteria bacterium]
MSKRQTKTKNTKAAQNKKTQAKQNGQNSEKQAGEKVAVVLFNLGGPDSKQSIKPFLFNFFMDKNIIRAPIFVRYPLAKLISIRRSKREAGESYNELGDKSPLLENSQEQAAALEKKLNAKKSDPNEYRVHICMRYWHPMADDVAAKVRDEKPDRVMLLPLYPQFSTTTTRSSLQVWNKAAEKTGLNAPTSMLCCYPLDDGYIKASAQNVKKQYDKAVKQSGQKKPRILFSAHGLPEDIITDGDPYQWQCEQSAKAIVKYLRDHYGMKGLDWAICYQSRVGPKKWIGPSTEDELKRAAKDQKAVVIYPHAFTQEHVETLVEIEIEYREEAEKMGLPYMIRVPTVSTSAAFINGLAKMVTDYTDAEDLLGPARTKTGNISRAKQGSICPKSFKRCCARSCGVRQSA